MLSSLTIKIYNLYFKSLTLARKFGVGYQGPENLPMLIQILLKETDTDTKGIPTLVWLPPSFGRVACLKVQQSVSDCY